MKYEIGGKSYSDIGVYQDKLGPVAKITGNSDIGYTLITGYHSWGPYLKQKDAIDHLIEFEEGNI